MLASPAAYFIGAFVFPRIVRLLNQLLRRNLTPHNTIDSADVARFELVQQTSDVTFAALTIQIEQQSAILDCSKGSTPASRTVGPLKDIDG